MDKALQPLPNSLKVNVHNWTIKIHFCIFELAKMFIPRCLNLKHISKDLQQKMIVQHASGSHLLLWGYGLLHFWACNNYTNYNYYTKNTLIHTGGKKTQNLPPRRKSLIRIFFSHAAQWWMLHVNIMYFLKISTTRDEETLIITLRNTH